VQKKLQTEGEDYCVFPPSSNEKGTGLETDIPDLEKKIQNPPRAKLVQQLPSTSLRSKGRGFRRNRQLPVKVLNESAVLSQNYNGLETINNFNNFDSNNSFKNGNVRAQTGDDQPIQINQIVF